MPTSNIYFFTLTFHLSAANTLHIYTAMEINAMKLPGDSFRADFNARWSLEQIIQSTE